MLPVLRRVSREVEEVRDRPDVAERRGEEPEDVDHVDDEDRHRDGDPEPERDGADQQEREARDDEPETDRAVVHEVGDRREAIRLAVSLAGPGDTVVVAGKGHETGQEVHGTVHPFDDRVVLLEELSRR